MREQIELNQKHPTQKPIKLFRYLVKVSSNKGDLVLDPFCGAGTTGVACKQTQRRYLLADINEEYKKITNNRLGQNNLLDMIEG